MNKKQIWLIVLVVVIIIIVWSVLRPSAQETNSLGTEPIKVGVLYGFTGAASTWADMGKKAVDLAVKEVNETGGINGQTITLVYEDSQTNPSKSVLAFNKLITEGVKVVIGDVWSFTSNPLIPIADAQKITVLSPTVMDASVEGKSPYYFATGHSIESQREALERFFEMNKDIKTISVLCWTDAYGKANRELLLDIINKRNIKIVSDECIGNFGATYQAEITKVKAANPDVIYFNTALPDVVLRKIKDLGLGEKKVITLNPVIDAIEVNKIPVSYMKNVYFVNWTPNQQFVDKFKAEYGVSPIIEAQNHYDTMRAVAYTLKKGGDVHSALTTIKFEGVEEYNFDFTKNDPIRVNEGKASLYTYDGEYHKID